MAVGNSNHTSKKTARVMITMEDNLLSGLHGLADDQQNSGGSNEENPVEEARLRETKKRPRPSSATSKPPSPSLPAQYISDGGEDNDGAEAVESRSKREVVPPLVNPLHRSKVFLQQHILALRLEAELAPMRVIVARLMTNPTHNRRGIFNFPVDPVKLSLLDYFKIIETPMDLGTIKAKLHAVAYQDREEVVSDIRLVFQNAMRYNPPDNTVHICAKHLMKQFDEWYEVTRLTKGSLLLPYGKPKVVVPSAPWISHSSVVTPSSPASRLRSATPPSTRTISSKSIQDSSITAPLLVKDISLKGISSNSFCGEVGRSVVEKAAESLASLVPGGATVLPTATIPSTATQHKQTAKLHIHSNWKDPGPMDCEKALKRAINVANKHAKHNCGGCFGRTCGMCRQGCIQHEPSLLICSGSNCGGTKIRKGATYYIAKDGSRQFCQRCYSNLQAVLPFTSDQLENMGVAVRYKRDLLKRRNDEEVPERWLTCVRCEKAFHKVCVMFNEFKDSEDEWSCPGCVVEHDVQSECENVVHVMPNKEDDVSYSFVSGSEQPMKLNEVQHSAFGKAINSAEDLPHTSISSFVERKVRERLQTNAFPDAEKTVTVRMISTTEKCFKVPDVVRKHFRMVRESGKSKSVVPPVKVHYKSKGMMLFQKIDGLDVCIFCMYVQEYDGRDEFDEGMMAREEDKRVYIAYLDSVEHFRPRIRRTAVYHEMLVAYLATARARGFQSAHIWACPPSRGNSFVFWNHPGSQRTPTQERLVAWYHGALSRAVAAGVVTDVSSLYESNFRDFMESQDDHSVASTSNRQQEGVVDGRLVCPPLLDGDFWIEEAVRAHAENVSRFMRSRGPTEFGTEPTPLSIDPLDRGCPATEIATMLRDRIIPHARATAFRRPVNAAALGLKDYHKIIETPMDLGTIYSHCLLGEYSSVVELVSDAELVFANAMRYNPKGNPVHEDAVAMRKIFFQELQILVSRWKIDEPSSRQDNRSWQDFSEVSLNLDARIDLRENHSAATKDIPCDDAIKLEECRANPTPIIIPSVVVESSPVPSPVLSDNDERRKHPSSTKITHAACEQPNLVPLNEACSIGSVPKRGIEHQGSKWSIASNTGRKPISLHSPTTIRRTSSFRSSRKERDPHVKQKLALLTGGTEAIEHLMVGDDTWLLEKRAQSSRAPSKKASSKRRKSSFPEAEEDQPVAKRRRQSWLGEEVGASVRRMRTVFFTCHLQPKEVMTNEERSKVDDFAEYIQTYEVGRNDKEESVPSALADQRHALLEFSQFRNLEFDTLRRAKHSTSILLYHLHNQNAPGLVPSCTSCLKDIVEVRWHRIRAAKRVRPLPTFRPQQNSNQLPRSRTQEELCGTCFEKVSFKESGDFVPLPVSFRNGS